MSVHERSKGYHQGAQDYVAGRPGYPPEAVFWLRDVIGVGPGRRVLEIGAGTGKFIPSLQAAGGEIIAVEPIAEMRDQLQKTFPGVVALAGSAEELSLPDASVDAVVCAQAFHWFATAKALGEMHRVLRPGGTLGLIWNGRDETVPWVAALSEITDRLEGDTPRYRSGTWRTVLTASPFELVDERHGRHAHVGTAEEVVLKRTMSVSFIAGLPSDRRAEVERDVRELIERTPQLADPCVVEFPYKTSMYAFRAL